MTSVIDPTMTAWAFVCIAMGLAAWRGVSLETGLLKAGAFFAMVSLMAQGVQALPHMRGESAVTELVGWSLALIALGYSLLRAGKWLGN